MNTALKLIKASTVPLAIVFAFVVAYFIFLSRLDVAYDNVREQAAFNRRSSTEQVDISKMKQPDGPYHIRTPPTSTSSMP
jgi:hypothetical protein